MMTPRVFGAAITFAALVLLAAAPAEAGRIIRKECRDGSGNRHWCENDARIGVCSSGTARADVWVDETGYYRLRAILYTNDSGDEQRDEAFVLLVKNSRKPEGFPVDPNCEQYKVIPDGVQDREGDLGVFYMMEGEANRLEVVHYCILYNDGQCRQFFVEGGEDGCGCNCNCESVGFEFDGLSAIPDRPCHGTTDYEWCDGVDNDCDDQVDEDQDGDGSGACEDCAPDDPNRYPGAPEACDGVDNDCDDQIDEDAGNGCGGCDPIYDAPGTPCGTCGTFVCVDARSTRCEEGDPNACGSCVALDGMPGAPCGECGTWVCDDAGAVACQDAGFNACGVCGELPAEVCDGVDNDCDGAVDEVGAEVCNCRDDDCDGQIDENDPCGAGQVCQGCRCATRCGAGECPDPNTVCVDGTCQPRPCPEAPCDGNLVCEDGLRCVDPCRAVTCPRGSICVDGECADPSCHTVGCPDGLLCVRQNCVPDPCAGVGCPAGEFCRDGLCVGSCADVRCAEGQRCEDGACVADPCAGARCSTGRVCRDGECIWNQCADIECPEHLVCVEGVCTGDPCDWTRCPAGQFCIGDGQCVGPAAVDPGADAGPGIAGDAGAAADPPLQNDCTCRLGAPGGAPWFALVLLGFAVQRRRRRR